MTSDPDALLRDLGFGDFGQRGRHKVYVGMAAGVGKTYRALHEIRELVSQGRDAIIGVLETHGREDTKRAAEDLPVFPRRVVAYKGVTLTELDTDGLVARRPEVVLVDELAHTNAPGSARRKRFEDVEVLLAAGISVISTVNVQHLESLNDLVARLTGVRVKERLPDHVLKDADEVILVDVTPEALRDRLRAGKIYAADKIEQALSNFFTDVNLSVLREIALRQVADTVEVAVPNGAVKDRVLVAVTPEAYNTRLIRRGGRIAERLGGQFDVVHVPTGRLSREETHVLDSFRVVTQALGGTFEVVPNRGGVGRTLVWLVRERRVTQVVLGESRHSRLQELLRGSIVSLVLRETIGADVYVMTRE